LSLEELGILVSRLSIQLLKTRERHHCQIPLLVHAPCPCEEHQIGMEESNVPQTPSQQVIGHKVRVRVRVEIDEVNTRSYPIDR
jgi:hypothetical protein